MAWTSFRHHGLRTTGLSDVPDASTKTVGDYVARSFTPFEGTRKQRCTSTERLIPFPRTTSKTATRLLGGLEDHEPLVGRLRATDRDPDRLADLDVIGVHIPNLAGDPNRAELDDRDDERRVVGEVG